MDTVFTIPRSVTQGEELIVVRRKKYEQLKKHLAEVKDALAKIRQDEKELREGKTRIFKSLTELRR